MNSQAGWVLGVDSRGRRAPSCSPTREGACFVETTADVTLES